MNNFNKIFISTKIPRSNQWTPDEDKLLISLALHFKEKNWVTISHYFLSKKPSQCRARYKRIRPGIIKGTWSQCEDKIILQLVNKYGKNWAMISKYMPTRNGKQIRDRYVNYLDPGINTQKFTQEEDNYIIKKYVQYGSKWSSIARELKGRTGDMIKNRFYSTLKKKIIKEGGNKHKTKLSNKKTNNDWSENIMTFDKNNFYNNSVVNKSLMLNSVFIN